MHAFFSTSSRFLPLPVLLLLLVGCGGGGGKKSQPSPTATPVPAVSVDLTAGANSISSGQSALLTWNAQNATAVVGSNFGAATTSGNATVKPTETTTYLITVRDSQGNQASDTTTVTVTPVVVTASPSPARIDISQPLRFAANVTGTSDIRVVWSVEEPTGGSITQEGVYTAPAVPGTYHVLATSVVDPSKVARLEVQVLAASGTVILN